MWVRKVETPYPGLLIKTMKLWVTEMLWYLSGSNFTLKELVPHWGKSRHHQAHLQWNVFKLSPTGLQTPPRLCQGSGLLWEGGTTKGPRESIVSKFSPWAPAFAKRAAYPADLELEDTLCQGLMRCDILYILLLWGDAQDHLGRDHWWKCPTAWFPRQSRKATRQQKPLQAGEN